MKKINYILIVTVLIASAISSCELEEELVQGKLTPAVASEDGGCSQFDSAGITSNGAQIVAIGNQYQQGDQLWRGATTVASDEIIIPTQGADWFNDGKFVAYHTHNFVPSDLDLTITFGALGGNIFSSERNVGVFNSRGETELAAQAKVIAAYTKWMMLDNFGVVQVQNLAPCNLDEDPNFLRGTEAFQDILDDLTSDVIDRLPDVDYGNPTKATAHALLARLYLNRFIYENREPSNADMDLVIGHAEEVVAAGFRLSDINLEEEWFTTNFGVDNDDSPENIWVLANQDGANIGGIAGGLIRPQIAWNQGGWNGMAVVADFYNSFDPDDPRFSAPGTPTMLDGSSGRAGDPSDSPALNFGLLSGPQMDAEGEMLTDRVGNNLSFTVGIKSIRAAAEFEGPRMVKFEPSATNSVNPANDFALLRYADVHLMKAEAEWRKGNAGAAIALINELRVSRGFAKQLTSIGGDGREILDERGFELYNEMIRRTDQIRFGTFQDAWEHKEAEPDKRSNLFPIPSDFVALYPDLNQNEGF